MTDICAAPRRATRLSIIAFVSAIVLVAPAAVAQSLGSAQSFAVLGASTVTNTGASLISGNVGVSPGTSITGFPPGVVVSGSIHAGDVAAAQAHADASVASAKLKALPCPSINNLSGRVLGTDVLTLPPGVYCFDTSASLVGTLGLTGAGPWVFQIGTTLTTATASAVVVIDAGANCSGSNVFWQLGTSATLGTATHFAGHVLASVSVTATTGVSVSGSLIALIGAVTLDTNAVSACAAGAGGVPPPEMDKCEEHRDKDGDDHDRDEHDKNKDKDHKDKDHDGKDKKTIRKY